MGRVQSVGKLIVERGDDESRKERQRGTGHHVKKVEKSLGIITEEKAQNF